MPRWQVSYTLGRLKPGKPYFVKLLAKNVIGFSNYSEWNAATIEQSFTAVEPPEIPTPPAVVNGTCHSLSIEFNLPYSNGTPIIACYTQQREIGAFHKGPWEKECEYNINNTKEVEIIKIVDAIEDEFDVAMPEDGGKIGDVSYNPFDKKKKKTIDITKANKFSNVSGPEYILKVVSFIIYILLFDLLMLQKPEGSRVRIVVQRLSADTVYEFRVACRNAAGRSIYSEPSMR